MRIIIDGDACPKGVFTISQELGDRYKVPVWSISNSHHNLNTQYHILVEDHPQATDTEMMNMAKEGDIAITHDLGLIALLLSKKVRCLSLWGREYYSYEMDSLLYERELKAKYRREGGRTKGPKKRKRQEDEAFAIALERILLEELKLERKEKRDGP